MKPNRPMQERPDLMRLAAEMVHSSRLTYKEIAARLGTSATDVRMAARKLREESCNVRSDR